MLSVRDVSSANASDSMVVSCESVPKLTVVRAVHLMNARGPMTVTLSGMVTEVREVQFMNASLPIAVTVAPPNVPGMVRSAGTSPS